MDRRIQKLLAIANDPGAPPEEAATARRLAERLSRRTLPKVEKWDCLADPKFKIYTSRPRIYYPMSFASITIS